MKNRFTIILLLVALFAGCTGIGRQMKKKNEKISVVRIKRQKKRKKTPAKRKKQPALPPVSKKAEKPEDFPDTMKAIRLFEKFLKNNKDKDDQEFIADTNLKIAELYFKYEENRYDKAMKQYDEVIEKSGFKALTEFIEPPAYDFSKAIEYYTYIIENFPAYKKLDAVYYGLAYSYYEQNQKELAQTTFKKLIKQFSNSIFANESHMRTGEYYFSTNQFEEAAFVFENMLKKKNNPYYSVILYKLGWTYFNEGNFDDAIKTFLLIKKKGKDGSTSTISRGLFNESMNYVARMFAGTSGLGGLVDYFKKSSKKEYLPDLIRFLGNSYKEEEAYERARKAYNKFLKMYPIANTVPIVEHSIIELNEKTRKKEKVLDQLRSFVDKYDAGGEWFMNVKDKITKGEVFTIVKIAEAKIALYKRSVHTLFDIINETTGLRDSSNVRQYLRSGQKDVIKSVCYKNIGLIFANSTGVEGLLNYVVGKVPYKIHLPEILKSIGDIYKEQNRQWQAVQAYQVLLEKYPGLEDAPIIQNTIVQIYEQGKNPEKAIEERKAFVDKFSPGSEWYDAEKINSDRRWGTMALAEKSLRTIALYYHARTQKNKTPEDLGEAIAYYEKYLKFFPEHTHIYEMTFFFAELLNEFKSPDESIEYYEKVAWSGGEKEKQKEKEKKEEEEKVNKKLEKYRRDAAYAIIVIYENLRKDETYFGQYSEALIQTIYKFAGHFPNNKKNPELLFKAGGMLFKSEKYNKAQTFFVKLINAYPQHTFASEAIRLVAQGYFELGKYDEAENWYATALTSVPAGKYDPERENPLKKMLASTKFKKAEQMQAEGKLLEAGKEFFEISKITPDPLVSSIALFNAGINFKKKEKCDMLFKVNSELLSKHPESKFSNGAMLSYMECEEKKQEWTRGAENIKTFARTHSYLKQLSEPLFLSAEFYKKDGNLPDAHITYLLFAKKFPHDPKIVEAFSMAGEFEYKRKNLSNAKKYFEESYSGYENLVRDNKDVDAYHAVKSKFMLGEIFFESFKEVKIVEPVKQSLTKKQQLLEKTLSEYTLAANFKITEWTTASTYRIGMVFEEFKEALLNSEKPKGLTPEEIEDYEILLEEQAYPFEDKAIEAYQANVKRLYSDRLYNEWIEQTIDRLAYLFPWSYNKKEDVIKDSRLYTILKN